MWEKLPEQSETVRPPEWRSLSSIVHKYIDGDRNDLDFMYSLELDKAINYIHVRLGHEGYDADEIFEAYKIEKQ